MEINHQLSSPLVRVLKAALKFRGKKDRRSWLTTHRIADKHRPRMVSTLLTETRGIRNKVNVARLSRAVAAGNVAEMEATLLLPSLDANLKRKYNRQMRNALNEAGVASVKLQPKVLAGAFGNFNLTNPRAIAWAQQRSATLVAEVTNSVKATIRTMIAQGIEQGIPVRTTARRMRDTVGLTTRQADAVQNFRAKQLARGVPADIAEKRTARYNTLQLQRRAEMIARTETIDAALQGRAELWDQAADKGLIDRDKATRRWIVTPDDLLDEFICEGMDRNPNNQKVPLDGMFETKQGNLVHKPPAHPGCRCDVVLNVPGKSIFAQ